MDWGISIYKGVSNSTDGSAVGQLTSRLYLLIIALFVVARTSHVVAQTSTTSSTSVNYSRADPHPMSPRFLSPILGLLGPDLRYNQDTTPRIVGRWRLEKQNASAAISDVVRSITCRIDTSVPRRWVPWIQRGIEEWNAVLEEIGLRKAIVVYVDAEHKARAKIVVSRSAEGLQTLTPCEIIWGGTHPQNTFLGTTKVAPDSRTGEISSCTITLWGGALPWRQAFFELGATHLQESLALYAVPSRLLHAIMQHEMGHCLGLNHYIREGRYPLDSIRNANFVRRMSHTPSIMSYQWFNRVAQPKDSIPFEDMFAKIGPHDRWLIGLLYRPIPHAESPEAELPVLQRWQSAQDTAMYVRILTAPWSGINVGLDEARGAEYRIQRLAATVTQIIHEDTAQHLPWALDSLRTSALGWWQRWLRELCTVIGGSIGVHPYPRTARDARAVPYDSASQIYAMRSLINRLFFGQDPFIAAVFQRPAFDSIHDSFPDTTLIVFDMVPSGWEATVWQEHQRSITRYLIKRVKSATKDQPSLIPALCNELARVHRALAVAVRESGLDSRSRRAQIDTLSQIIGVPMRSATGVCARSMSPGSVEARHRQ
jgi:hypothetical protein